MTEVVRFPSAITPADVPPTGDPEIIATLEGLLERAKSGRLTGLAYCTLARDGTAGTGWDGAAGTRYPLAAAVGMLNVRYHQALLNGD